MTIPAKLVPSPFCAPARISGQKFAQPVRKQKRWVVDAYPIGHPLREQAKDDLEMQQLVRETARRATSNALLATEMARHGAGVDYVASELDAEWERLRLAYASTVRALCPAPLSASTARRALPKMF